MSYISLGVGSRAVFVRNREDEGIRAQGDETTPNFSSPIICSAKSLTLSKR